MTQDDNYHDDDYTQTLEEELSEILEAFYSMVSEEEIRKYQDYTKGLQQEGFSRESIQAPSMAPDFELTDQDGETVNLSGLLEHGPVVLVFYRGKWCPQCNATIMHFQRHLEEIQAKGATLVAISPMLPDGTQVFSTKRSLQFPVLSDVGNGVARKFNITFTVPEDIRPTFLEWGDDIPATNGDSTWELPMPATYIISRTGEIVWSFVEEDSGKRAEFADVVSSIPDANGKEETIVTEEVSRDNKRSGDSLKRSKKVGNRVSSLKRSVNSMFRKKKVKPKTLFGNKQQEAGEFLSQYMCPDGD